jgi:diguanylate cyclase (GGDEF)-like protein
MPLTSAFLRVLRGVLMLVALLVGAYTLATAWNLTSDYTRTLEGAKNDARNLAAALDEHAGNTFGETSRTLLSLAETMPFDHGKLDVPRAHALLNARIKRTRYLAGLAIYGASGEVVTTTNSAATRSGIAKRPDFAFHAESPVPQIYIVAPGAPAQPRVIRVSTRLPAPDGSFAGVVEAQVDPEYFNLFYTAINVGTGGRIYLLRQDGVPLVEVPDTGQAAAILAASPGLRERLRTTVSDTVADDTIGILAYRRAAKLPLVAMVSLSRDEVIAPWRERVLKQGVSAVAVLALVGILVWVVWRQISHLGAQDKALQGLVEKRTAELEQRNTELRQAYDALEAVSITDQLTGLKNRRYLMQHLTADVALALRRYKDRRDGDGPGAGADLVFFLIDIDHFKSVNDAHGHAIGDRTLVEFSRRLEQVFRDSDLLVRWGGEEFLAVARGAERGDAEAIAEKIRDRVASEPFDVGDGLALHVTCSIGAASFPFIASQPELLSWAEVVQLADRALYLAKREGRDRAIAFFATAATQADLVRRYLASPEADPSSAFIIRAWNRSAGTSSAVSSTTTAT